MRPGRCALPAVPVEDGEEGVIPTAAAAGCSSKSTIWCMSSMYGLRPCTAATPYCRPDAIPAV